MTAHATCHRAGPERGFSDTPFYHLGSFEKSHHCFTFASELADPSPVFIPGHRPGSRA